MNERRRFDHNSINFRIWAYFTLFAVVIVILIWVLQAWFLNNRYESMKQVETSAIAGKIRMAFQAESPAGMQIVTVTKVTPETITVDANHELAGKNLHFAIKIVDVRDATPEELESGMQGGCGGGCGGCCDDDCSCDGGCGCS